MAVERFVDYQGRRVELTEARWAHIVTRHDDMIAYHAEIRAAIGTPIKAIRDPKISRVEHLYRLLAGRRMVTVIIIYRPTPDGWVGEILTSFTTGRFVKGEQLWP